MAELLAEIMATTTQKTGQKEGLPSVASRVDINAKGSANIECSNLIISKSS